MLLFEIKLLCCEDIVEDDGRRLNAYDVVVQEFKQVKWLDFWRCCLHH